VVWIKLVDDVIKMLDLKRQLEKAQGELLIAKQQKAEREKKERAARGETEPEAAESEENANGIKMEDERSVRGGSVQRSVRGGSAQRSVRGMSAAHKRSASVLSTTSDNGTKRQKK